MNRKLKIDFVKDDEVDEDVRERVSVVSGMISDWKSYESRLQSLESKLSEGASHFGTTSNSEKGDYIEKIQALEERLKNLESSSGISKSKPLKVKSETETSLLAIEGESLTSNDDFSESEKIAPRVESKFLPPRVYYNLPILHCKENKIVTNDDGSIIIVVEILNPSVEGSIVMENFQLPSNSTLSHNLEKVFRVEQNDNLQSFKCVFLGSGEIDDYLLVINLKLKSEDFISENDIIEGQ